MLKLKTNKTLQIFIISVLLIGFMGTSVISYMVSRSSIRSQIINKQLPLTSDNVYSEVQNDILKPIFISSLMASDTFLRDWVIKGEKDPKEIERYLKEIKNKYGVFSSFFVSDATLNYYYPEGLLKKIKENEIRDLWYFRVKQMATDYEVNVDPDMANHDNLTIFINYKVFDYNKKYLGATGVGLKVDKVNNVISEYQKKYKSNIHFVDKNGKIRLSSNLPIGVEYDQKISANVSSYSYEKNGENILANVRYIPEFKWYLVVEQSDTDDVKILSKTLILNLLITFLISSIIIVIITKKWMKYHNELQTLALTDKLSGVLNRQSFEVDSNILIEKSRNNTHFFTLMMFDIDNFKIVNDTYGHNKGDEVIKTIVTIAKDNFRKSDKIYRWGGDEFIVLFDGKSLDEAYDLVEIFRKDIENHVFLKGLKVTISGGVAQYQKEENIDFILKKVDEYLYKSKLLGKNRIEK